MSLSIDVGSKYIYWIQENMNKLNGAVTKIPPTGRHNIPVSITIMWNSFGFIDERV